MTNGPLAVRPATVGDAEVIAKVHVGTWQAAYRGIVPDKYLDALDADRRAEGWRVMLSGRDPEYSGPVWVAERDGAVVGFASTGASRDEPGVGELYGIYVDAAHWGTGAGHALMLDATAWLSARYPEATLWVLGENDRARRFYEAGGWYADGATKDDDRGSFVLHEVRYRIEF